MSNTPWVDRKSVLEITHSARGNAKLSPLDMGYIYFFKNGEAQHFCSDKEAMNFYEKNYQRLNATKPE